MNDHEIAIVGIVSTLSIVVFIILVILLLLLNQRRRGRHRIELAELRADHAEEVRKVEQEVVSSTLAEVGGELHDNVGQLLTVGRMGLNALKDSTTDHNRLDQLKVTIDKTISEVRRLSRTLKDDNWANLSLLDALQQECERVRRNTDMSISCMDTGAHRKLPADEKLVLFRIFQEAMNNALKHAQASVIEVHLDNSRGTALMIRDNGIGSADYSSTDGQGIANMKRRAELLNYHCRIERTIGAGTTVTITSNVEKGGADTDSHRR